MTMQMRSNADLQRAADQEEHMVWVCDYGHNGGPVDHTLVEVWHTYEIPEGGCDWDESSIVWTEYAVLRRDASDEELFEVCTSKPRSIHDDRYGEVWSFERRGQTAIAKLGGFVPNFGRPHYIAQTLTGWTHLEPAELVEPLYVGWALR